MSWRTLSTFEAVVCELGGGTKTARLLDVTPPMVCHWRKRGGRFPARTMERIHAELARKGKTAARSLFDFDPPREYDDEPKRATRA